MRAGTARLHLLSFPGARTREPSRDGADGSAVTRARSALGATILAASRALDRPHAVRPDGWYGLTGDTTTSLALGLAHGPDSASTVQLAELLDGSGVPALLALAGEARSHRGATARSWQRVARVPIMVRDLAGPSTDLPDARVRPATPGDLPDVTDVVVSASGVTPWDALLVTTPATSGDGPLRAWVLEERGEVVSTVVTGRVGDTITLWPVATPPERARRGHGRALLASVLADARLGGATYGVLAAPPRSRRWYGAGGWRTVEEWELLTNRARS